MALCIKGNTSSDLEINAFIQLLTTPPFNTFQKAVYKQTPKIKVTSILIFFSASATMSYIILSWQMNLFGRG